MNNKFDELTKELAQSTTRRAALRKFGVGLVGVALAFLGFANKATAHPNGIRCHCKKPNWGCDPNDLNYNQCTLVCSSLCSP